MKKKIVYISGADVFDVNDVRAAFDEVRNTLKLAPDTILFGVPVDDAECVETVTDDVATNVPDMPVEPESNMADVNDINIDEPIPEIVATESNDADTDTNVIDDTPAPESATPVVPILSVLASQENEAAPVDANDAMEIDTLEPVQDTADENETETIELDDDAPGMADMINDELPDEPVEKTLEELLETMEPLREDVDVPHKKKSSKTKPQADNVDEIDATLENLASEFAENQDKVAGPKKGTERGKIGKLKNILPFKKMKRDDTGLMGDLFGWAGIAANDDEFTIPGFFKQKM